MLWILFGIEVIYAGWSTVKYKSLDLEQVKKEPVFIMSSILQVYLGCMAIKDGLILISMTKNIQCVNQKKLLYLHCFS